MDNLVLTTVARALDEGLRGSVLDDLRQESIDRFRLRWESRGRVRSTAISLRPDAPWIGRPCTRTTGNRGYPGRFAGEFRRILRGARLAAVVKPSSDRRIELRFSEGRTLVVELAIHGANLVLLDAAGAVLSSLRQPRSAHERLVVGRPYGPPMPPEGLLDPFVSPAREMDAVLERLAQRGEAAFEGIRRHLFGVGSAAATLVCDEAVASGRSHGDILADRLVELGAGRVGPVIEAPKDSAVALGFDPVSSELWPWQPDREPREGCVWLSGADAAETAGWWYETRDARRRQDFRHRALAQIVHREATRNRHAIRKCEADLRAFEDPQCYRRWAEALLAGLSQAQRVGQGVRVPDPEDPEGGDLVVPVSPAMALTKAAEQLFGKHRRALRGGQRAKKRLEDLVGRERALVALEQRFAESDWTEEQRIAEMRRLRLPVALEPDTRAGREASRRAAPRLEGVRVYYASSGELILAGKGGRENHRLTFKLAAPHDFWLHAQDVTGAHVILRNDSRAPRPGPALAEAAAVAAFHSRASSQPYADVQWTLRKNVKKPRGAKPGTVVLKRFETIRVRPRLPS